MNTRFLVLTTLAAALAACSAVPARNPALEQARGRLNAAQSEAQVSRHAPEEIRRAGTALRLAEKAQADGETPAVVDHLAYLANQRVTLAEETASGRAAQAVTAQAGAERDRMRLALRTQEVDAAQQKLRASEQDGARKSADLAEADRSARDDKARLARSDARADGFERLVNELNARKTERGIIFTLDDLLFDTGRSRLQTAGALSMVKLADFLKRNPQRQASIEGYTDSVGNAAANRSLSGQRARAVMAALVDLGVASGRLSSSGHGEDNPVADNGSAAGRQQNRRVEVVFAPAAGDMLTAR
jgi:outer membrane protein OmpA-like peptidoglycan-associated protein